MNFFARERTRMVKDGAIEIFVESDKPGIQCRKAKIMAILEFFPIQAKNVRRFLTRCAVPAIGEDHSSYVPEHRSNFRQDRGLQVYALAAVIIQARCV